MAASFMARKKKYKFQVEVCLEELLEVPFVSAVLFAKLRLLDGGGFQDHSSRQEVRDHRVQWNATFAFPCKMMANASTGVMERCVLRVSVRKESKGGRSFHKLGFVDLNLAEFAGAGLARRKALLEGYDARHRQDNSMLKFRIQMNMISGDILFKAPSPSLKHKEGATAGVAAAGEEEAAEGAGAGAAPDQPRPEELAGAGGGGSSLAGSVASGSSGFGSLPKKRPPLLTSELVAGQPQAEAVPQEAAAAPEAAAAVAASAAEAPGHSRNSSNTSQLSRVSGYASLHSRQSSSGGDSAGGGGGHARRRAGMSPPPPTRATTTDGRWASSAATSTPKRPATAPPPATDETFHTPRGVVLRIQFTAADVDTSGEEYRTPDCTPAGRALRKSPSAGVVAAAVRADADVPAFLTPGVARRAAAGQRAVSMGNLGHHGRSSFPHHHRKLLDGGAGAGQNPKTAAADCDPGDVGEAAKARRQSVALANASGGGEACGGSLERPASAAGAKRKGAPSAAAAAAAAADQEGAPPGRVEITRVDTAVVIEELLKSTNLEPADDAAETSGLQLFIAKDGTAALGNHEVKQQMGAGAQLFQQVVVDAGAPPDGR